MSKERDATPPDWESIISHVVRRRAQAESDVAKYDAEVKSGARRDVPEQEMTLRQTLLDLKTTERVLNESYKQQYPDRPTA